MNSGRNTVHIEDYCPKINLTIKKQILGHNKQPTPVAKVEVIAP
jgi:hypothetical protein